VGIFGSRLDLHIVATDIAVWQIPGKSGSKDDSRVFPLLDAIKTRMGLDLVWERCRKGFLGLISKTMQASQGVVVGLATEHGSNTVMI
jgi:hypothetical protein